MAGIFFKPIQRTFGLRSTISVAILVAGVAVACVGCRQEVAEREIMDENRVRPNPMTVPIEELENMGTNAPTRTNG